MQHIRLIISLIFIVAVIAMWIRPSLAQRKAENYRPLGGNPNVLVRVGPEPDWIKRMKQAWEQKLHNARRQPVGRVPAHDGRLLIGEPATASLREEATVQPGDYEVSITILSRRDAKGKVTDERISHAFALRVESAPLATVEVLKGLDGQDVELGVDAGLAAFATLGAEQRLIAERAPGGDVHDLETRLLEDSKVTYASTREWTLATTSDGAAAIALFSSGEGDGTYPVYRMADAENRTIGIAIDFLVDD